MEWREIEKSLLYSVKKFFTRERIWSFRGDKRVAVWKWAFLDNIGKKKKKIIKNKKKKKRGEEKTRVQQFFLCNNKALVRAKRASSLGILPYSTAVERDRESWKRGFVTLSYFSFLALQTTDHGPAYYPTWRRKLLEDTRKKSSKKLPCTLFDYP